MKDLLNDAKQEILDLRRENEILRAKVETMDTLANIFFASPPSRTVGMKIDVAWELQKKIDAITAESEKLPANDTEAATKQVA
jgi:hypothetical protein